MFEIEAVESRVGALLEEAHQRNRHFQTEQTEFGPIRHLRPETVDHPAWYNRGKTEVVDFIEDQGLGYHLGNALKYLCRAGHKPGDDESDDLRKAIWFIQRRIEFVAKHRKNT